MHKKPLIAVLVVGLLLLSASAMAWDGAKDEAARIKAQAPIIAQPAKEQLVGPTISLQGGTNRTVPGTFCTGDWMDASHFIWNFSFGGYHAGDVVFEYQDPTGAAPYSWGAGCTLPALPFDVTAVNLLAGFRNSTLGHTWTMRALVFDVDNASFPGCPVPGALLSAGPAVVFSAGAANANFIFNVPFDIEACVAGEYFAAIEILAETGDGELRPITDQGQYDFFAPPNAIPRVGSRSYWYIGGFGALFDFVDVASAPQNPLDIAYGNTCLGAADVPNNQMWSEGYTPDDPATHCTPGLCDYQWWYPGTAPGAVDDGWDGAFGLPSGQYGGRVELGTRFEAIGLDTLRGAYFLLYGPFTSSPAPDIEVRVYAADGGVSLCGLPTPGTMLHSTVVPGASLSFYPVPTYVALPNLTFGTLNGGTPEQFFITIQCTPASVLAGLGTAFAAYYTGYFGAGCQPGMHSVAYYPNYDPDGLGDRGATWVYVGERADGTQPHGEWVLDADICAEQLPIEEIACTAGGVSDNWPTYMHDYARTGASDINVGDANDIVLEWSASLNGTMSFNNPTASDDWVYGSNDGAILGFDLLTGAPMPGSPFTGIPEMGTSNRCNVTVHNGFAYLTGGNFAALTKMPVGTLAKANIVWSNNATTQGSMTKQNRFGVATVIDNLDGAGTDVVFVLTEPVNLPGLQGELFAFDASNGNLYAGWATNPVLLDKAARHGPTYDGTNLYVGTADADLTDGSVWAIDPMTGNMVWQFFDNTLDAANPGGFPGGVSADGGVVYAASQDANGAGRRFALDAGTGAPIWGSAQTGGALYGAPTIGRNFVYITDDNNGGMLMVDKGLGLSVFNYRNAVAGTQQLGRVSQHASLSCDNVLFAGDRNGRWWVFDANAQDVYFYRDIGPAGLGLVNGTALASHSSGADFAVVGLRTDGTAGRVLAYRLGAGDRPRLQQNEFATQILVPLGVTGSFATSVDDVFEGTGDLPVTLDAATVNDISGLAASVRRPIPRDIGMQDRWEAKQAAMGRTADGEWRLSEYNSLMSKQQTYSRSQSFSAAGAMALRTTNIRYNGAATIALSDGDLATLSWDYDVSGLGRGVDFEDIVVTNDDPDFDISPLTSTAIFEITYQGGCAFAQDTLEWWAGTELITNEGGLGNQGDADNLVWIDDPFDPAGGTMYDGGIFLVGDSAITRAILFAERNYFAPNVAPTSGLCGFDNWSGTMGAYRTGGVPGAPTSVTGSIIVQSLSDTDFAAVPGSPEAAIGLDVIMTEVGADDALYGDFKLIRLELIDRYGNGAPTVYGGTICDWDVQGSYGSNYGGLWPNTVNGYAIWDNNNPGYAYGFLDPTQASLYSGVDPSTNPVHGMMTVDHNTRGLTPGNGALFYTAAVSESPLMVNEGPNDLAGLFVANPVSVPASGSAAIHMALFGVPAHAGLSEIALIEADAMSVAARAAKWAGFARGDVNDDGFVDLADVWWLIANAGDAVTYPLYPADYNGDVDLSGAVDGADQTYLMNYVSGVGAAPQGDWRF